MERFWKHDLTKLICGNLATGLLMIGVPVLILLQAVGSLETHQASFLLVAGVVFSLLGLQVSRNGSLTPRKWLAAFFLPLPMVNSALAISTWRAGHVGWSIAFLLLATGTVFVVVQSALAIIRKVPSTEPPITPRATGRTPEVWTHDDDFPMPI